MTYFRTITKTKITVDKRTTNIKIKKNKWSKTAATNFQVISVSFSTSSASTSSIDVMTEGVLVNSVTGVFSTVSVLLDFKWQLVPFQQNIFMRSEINRLVHFGMGFSTGVWKTLMTMMTNRTDMVPTPSTAARYIAESKQILGVKCFAYIEKM